MMGGRRAHGARRRPSIPMPFASIPISRVLAAAGTAYLAAIVGLVVTKAPLGSPIFFAAVVIGTVGYGAVLSRVWREPRAARRLLVTSFLLAAAMRIPMAVAPVGPDSDMVRYQWDGRVQLLGYSPYQVIPSDPAMAHTHTDQTASMPSRRDRTPYPPAAQLFFRLVVMLSDTTLAMKLALVACDLLTMIVLWRWLVATGRSEWLTLAYAWNPLVVFEIAHSGHIDALAALWITAAAFWLARRRTQLAAVAFVLAIATKLVPIVLAPLFIGRVRKRDAFTGALCLAALYLPFISGSDVPLGAVPNVVDRVRFNGPLFSAIAALTFPRFAAAVALAAGLSVALWARWRLPSTDPAAWAWPMAVAIAFAPVIYPWYLLCLTPFLFTVVTLPLTAWTVSALSVYEVWDLSRHGGRWITPVSVMVFEFGVLVVSIAALAVWRRRTRVDEDTAKSPHRREP
jgi:alpha-1,6-mannosyltransferase